MRALCLKTPFFVGQFELNPDSRYSFPVCLAGLYPVRSKHKVPVHFLKDAKLCSTNILSALTLLQQSWSVERENVSWCVQPITFRLAFSL